MAALLPDSKAIERLWFELRQAGLPLTPEQLAAAQYILINMHAHPDGEAEALPRLRGMLAGVFAKSVGEREIFFRNFDQSTLQQHGIDTKQQDAVAGFSGNLKAKILLPTHGHLSLAIVTMLLLLPVLYLISLAAVESSISLHADAVGEVGKACARRAPNDGLIGRLNARRGLPTCNTTPPGGTLDQGSGQVGPIHLPADIVGEVVTYCLMALPITLFVFFVIRRYMLHCLWMRIDLGQLGSALASYGDGGGASGLFSSQGIRQAARYLRNAEFEPTNRLDINQTVSATAQSGGHFSPRYSRERGREENMALVEQASMHDHLAHLYIQAVRQFSLFGVPFRTFTFISDPRVVSTMRGQSASLGTLPGNAKLQRLIIFGSGDALVDRISGVPHPYMAEELEQWPRRFLLSTKSLLRWGWPEARLVSDLGLSVGTATRKGLTAIGDAARSRELVPRFLDVRATRANTGPGAADRVLQAGLKGEPDLLLRLQSPSHGAWATAFSPSERWLVSAGGSGIACLWDLRHGRLAHTLHCGVREHVLAAAFSGDGRRIAVSGEAGYVSIFDIEGGRKITDLYGYGGWIAGLSVSADGTRLASAGQSGLAFWDVDNERLLSRRWPLPDGRLRSVALSRDNRLITFGGDNGQVNVIAQATGDPISRFDHGHPVRSVAFANNGRLLASAGVGRLVRLWTMDAEHQAPSLELADPGSVIRSVQFSPDNRMLFAGSTTSTVYVWSVSTGQMIRRYEFGFENSMSSMSLSLGGTKLALGESNGDIHIARISRLDARS